MVVLFLDISLLAEIDADALAEDGFAIELLADVDGGLC